MSLFRRRWAYVGNAFQAAAAAHGEHHVVTGIAPLTSESDLKGSTS